MQRWRQIVNKFIVTTLLNCSDPVVMNFYTCHILMGLRELKKKKKRVILICRDMTFMMVHLILEIIIFVAICGPMLMYSVLTSYEGLSTVRIMTEF